MSLTLARLCGEWRQIIQDMNNLLSESRWRNRKAVEEIEKPLKKLESHWRRFSRISWKAESHWRKQKAVEEIRKPLKKIFSDSWKSESRWRKSNFVWGKLEFRRRKISIFPRYSWVSGDCGVSFWHQICYHVCTWIYLIGFSVFQLLITLAFQMK